jgi:hypothetical protein
MHSTNLISKSAMLRGVAADALGVVFATRMPQPTKTIRPERATTHVWKSVMERTGRQLAFLSCLGIGLFHLGSRTLSS